MRKKMVNSVCRPNCGCINLSHQSPPINHVHILIMYLFNSIAFRWTHWANQMTPSTKVTHSSAWWTVYWATTKTDRFTYILISIFRSETTSINRKRFNDAATSNNNYQFIYLCVIIWMCYCRLASCACLSLHRLNIKFKMFISCKKENKNNYKKNMIIYSICLFTVKLDHQS